jgi:hypothetical protein
MEPNISTRASLTKKQKLRDQIDQSESRGTKSALPEKFRGQYAYFALLICSYFLLFLYRTVTKLLFGLYRSGF